MVDEDGKARRRIAESGDPTGHGQVVPRATVVSFFAELRLVYCRHVTKLVTHTWNRGARMIGTSVLGDRSASFFHHSTRHHQKVSTCPGHMGDTVGRVDIDSSVRHQSH